MGKRKPRKSGASGKGSDNPFTRPCLGNFTTIDVVDLAEKMSDATLKGVEKGSQLTRDALASNTSKQLPAWGIILYFSILIFAFLIALSPLLPEYRQAAIGYIFGQGPLLVKLRQYGVGK